MFKLSIKPQWQLARGDERQLLPRVVELLVGIHETGTLAAACGRMQLSYRYAWGLLQEGHAAFGVPLVQSRRGRGAVLTPLGERLVWADKRIAARLSPVFDSLASELEVELERALSKAQGILRMQASHGFAVELIREWLAREQIPLDLKYRSSFEALAAQNAGVCDIAGFHVPLGEFELPMLQHYRPWLQPATQRLIYLATRRQGLMVARGNPRQILGLADLQREGVRFVNRQVGSGTRVLLDLLLARDGVDVHRIDGYDSGEHTHAAVAAFVASGMADAAFGVETPARRFNLDFIPLINERYFFICNQEFLDSATMSRLISALRSAELQNAIGALPGYDGLQSGRISTLGETFPELLRP
ncbi:ModE molybdate transport repressor domain-containing protein [Solimonas aquatica]|uniref:ModE molybdate transport repressor domain-containing protein n=1 Tax=Solimonas aquatica TaxID=489703 RepID=A0A1H9JT79_9GAMM|nr:substrate-binding domain-containing protein [Solimonas aquatica]SEQ89997.1 ModE molybdate transport repressor domain-containing protein [Solimonas aquatica]